MDRTKPGEKCQTSKHHVNIMYRAEQTSLVLLSNKQAKPKEYPCPSGSPLDKGKMKNKN